MAASVVGGGIRGIALMRAAEAMLRSLGGTEVMLLLPSMNMPNDASAQLGLVDPAVDQVSLSPVVVRSMMTESTGPRRRIELLISAPTVAPELTTRNMASAQMFFDSALGVMYAGELFHIEGIATEYFAGTEYLYRVVAVD